jgi:hypothetical protein
MLHALNCFQEMYSDNMKLISRYQSKSITAQALEFHCPYLSAEPKLRKRLRVVDISHTRILLRYRLFDSLFRHLVLNTIIKLY